MVDEGWWKGQCHGQVGLFPATFVRMMEWGTIGLSCRYVNCICTFSESHDPVSYRERNKGFNFDCFLPNSLNNYLAVTFHCTLYLWLMTLITQCGKLGLLFEASMQWLRIHSINYASHLDSLLSSQPYYTSLTVQKQHEIEGINVAVLCGHFTQRPLFSLQTTAFSLWTNCVINKRFPNFKRKFIIHSKIRASVPELLHIQALPEDGRCRRDDHPLLSVYNGAQMLPPWHHINEAFLWRALRPKD